MSSVRDKTAERNARHTEAAIAYTVGIAFDEGEDVHTLTELVALSDRRAFTGKPLCPLQEE